jgi:hypothetical protein
VDAGVRVSELNLPNGVAAVVDPEELVVKLAQRRVTALEEEGAAAEVPEEGAEEPATPGEASTEEAG